MRASASAARIAAAWPSTDGRVMCVASGDEAVARDLGMDVRAARERPLALFQHQHRRAFAEHEAGAVLRERLARR
jgi:hypothetical protein